MNKNFTCAIDVETTGLDSNYHEIIQLAIVPLNAFFELHSDIEPFNIYLSPKYPERVNKKAMEINKLNLQYLKDNGLSYSIAIYKLFEWIFKNNLINDNMKIIPLGHNYAFDQRFLFNWMGQDLYEKIFDYHYKDTMNIAEFIKDRGVNIEKTNLIYLAKYFDIPLDKAHDALFDSIATAKIYKKFLHLK